MMRAATSKQVNGKRVNNGIVIATCIVLAIVVLSIWQYWRIRDTGVDIRYIDHVLYKTGQLSATEMQYELNVKNFLLTNDSSYADVAVDSARTLPGKIAELRKLMQEDPRGLTAENSLEMARIDSFEYLSREEGDLLGLGGGTRPKSYERVLGTIGAGGESHANVVRGKSAEIQELIERMETGQRSLLFLRRQTNLARASELQLALWVLIAAVLALGLVTFRRMRARQEYVLHASEERYKMLFEKSPLPKYIYDEETLQFLELNEAAIRLYGYTQEEFLKLTLADIRPAEDVEALMVDMEQVRRSPGSYKATLGRHLLRNGKLVEVDVTAHPVVLDGRRARLAVIVDMTEQRRHERELQRLNADLAKRAAELSASNAELERFAYIASHDLQEPLRMVSSFLQLLQKKYKGQLDAKADQYIHYAVDGSERMKVLIMDLLEYSRVGTGRESFDWVDCDKVMGEVGDIFRERMVAARAKVEIGPLPRVWGDRVQLAQLLQNLLSNALKYSGEEPPVIAISAEEKPDCWQFAVKDNGIGIDTQFFDKIFIIFQRLHNKSDYSGTGIGLAICKKIVERHGGKIWVESGSERRGEGESGRGDEGGGERGSERGSTFYFTINKKP
jgi:PAS domain S-box-containing protein